MAAAFADLVPDLFGLGAVDEVFPQPPDHLLQIVLKIVFRAVVVDQVLDDKTREFVDARVDGQPFVDDLASKNVPEACVHGVIRRL